MLFVVRILLLALMLTDWTQIIIIKVFFRTSRQNCEKPCSYCCLVGFGAIYNEVNDRVTFGWWGLIHVGDLQDCIIGLIS